MPILDSIKLKVTADTEDGKRGMRSMGREIDMLKSRLTLLNVAKAGAKIEALGSAASMAVSGINALGAGVVGLTSALGPLTGLLATAPSGIVALGTAMGSVKLATSGVGEAFKELSSVDAKVAQTSQKGTDTARERTLALRAQRNAAEHLADAQKALNEALKPAAVLDMREADLGLASARLELSAATADLYKMNRLLAESQQQVHKVVTGIKDDFTGKTLEFVTEVKGEDLGEQMRAQESARLRVEAATIAVLRAEEQIAELRKKGTEEDEAVITARRQLRDATESIADLHYEMARAQQQETEAAIANTEAVQKAMSKLSPEAQEFVQTIRGMKPLFEQTRLAAQDLFFAGVNDGLTLATKNWHVFDATMRSGALTMGFLANEAGRLLGDKGFGERFTTIVQNNDQAMRQAGVGLLKFVDGMSYLAVAAKPVVMYMGELTDELGSSFRMWAKTGQETGKLNDFFEKTVKVTKQVLDVVGNLYVAMRELGSAANEGLGDSLLQSLVDGTQKWADWTSNADNAKKTMEWFAGFRPVLTEMGNLLSAIAVEWVKLDGREELVQTMEILRKDALPVIVDFFSHMQSMGPMLIETLTNIAKVFVSISTEGSALQLLLPIINGIAQALAYVIEAVPGLDSLIAAMLTLASLKKIDAIIGLSTALTALGPKLATSALGTATLTQYMGAAAASSTTMQAGMRGISAAAAMANVGLLAVVGSVLYYQKVMNDAHEAAQKFGDEISKNFSDPGAMAYEEMIAKQNVLIREHNGLVDEANNSYGTYQEEVAAATHETGGLINENQKLIDATKKLARETGISADEAWAFVTAEDAAGREIDGNTELTGEYAKVKEEKLKEANKRLTDSTWGLIDSELALRGAWLDSSDAAQRFSDDVMQGKLIPGTADYERALQNLESTMLADAKATTDYAAAQAELEGKTLSAKDANQLQIDRLLALQATVGAESPLGQRLQQHIDKLKEASGKFEAELSLRITVAEAFANVGKKLMDAFTHKAAGGDVKAGTPYVVGEEGQELFVPNTDGYIVPNHALGGGGGSDAATLERVVDKVLERLRPVEVSNTFNEKVDAKHVSTEIAWELAK